MSRLVVATAAVCALSLVGAGGARAAIVVDQSNLVDTSVGALGGSGIRAPSTSFPFGTRQVQTVTAGLDGDLARLDLQVFKFGKLGTLRASLYDGDYARAKGMFSPPGSPGGFGVLITTTLTSLADLPTLAEAQAGRLLSFDTTGLHFHVHSGQVFSLLLELAPGPGTVAWANSSSDPSDPSVFVGLNYSRGYNSATFFDANFVQSGLDRGFRTWVAVPEPATWALMMLGFGLSGGALRRRAVRPA